MRPLRLIASVVLVGASVVGTAGVAASDPIAPGTNKLLCFDGTTDGLGYGGTCTVGRGALGPATLDNSDDNAAGDYAGVYVLTSDLYGSLLSDVSRLGYNYRGTTTPTPGNLSLNVPVDVDGDGDTDGWAYVDAYYCAGTDGHVDIVNDADCGIWFMGVEYASWDALVAAFPDARVATDNYVFIVAERTPAEPAAVWRITAVKFGSVA
jgi:hypothetical protein